MSQRNYLQEVTRPTFPWRKGGLVSYGLPFPELVAKHVQRLEKERVFAVISASLEKSTGSLSKLVEALGSKLVGSRVGFPSHTPWNQVLALAQQIDECHADLVVTIGGGSITDGVKLAALALANNIHNLEGLDAMSAKLKAAMQHDIDYKSSTDPTDVNPPTFSMINVPTTLSAGEFSPYAGGINPLDGVKKIFILQSLAADVVILDPEVAQNSPEWVWMSSGVRSIDHCVELLASLSKIDPETDEAAKKGLVLVARGLLKLRKDPMDKEARFETQLGSNYAMDGLCRGIHLGGSHAIGHQLGTMNVAHGVTSCVLSPSVMKYNSKVNWKRQQLAFDALWSDGYIRETLSKRSITSDNDLGDLLDGLFREYGVPRSLKEVGVEGEEKLSILAVRSLEDPWCRTNPIPLISPEQVLEILKMAE
ncbi:putative Fe-containing alcohol dehydrogenase [Xylogone sp. PMI_703]|nr:putative Fe-containing alcohol dehydrogenase [Xylogone sp. PMI_703]